MKTKLMLFRALGAIASVGCLCQCQSYDASSPAAPISSSTFVKSMLGDMVKNKPWKPTTPSKPTSADRRVGGGLVKATWEGSFKKGVDDPKRLLSQAREGDEKAWGKLQDYLLIQPNPGPAVRFEFERMSILDNGIDSIARYYAEKKSNKKASKDCQEIESAIRQMEGEALQGKWIYAVALYQFLGSLYQADGHLPWGRTEELSAKWLTIIYKSAGKAAFDNVIASEARRMGYRTDSGKIFFPHTSEGWNPKK